VKRLESLFNLITVLRYF